MCECFSTCRKPVVVIGKNPLGAWLCPNKNKLATLREEWRISLLFKDLSTWNSAWMYLRRHHHIYLKLHAYCECCKNLLGYWWSELVVFYPGQSLTPFFMYGYIEIDSKTSLAPLIQWGIIKSSPEPNTCSS